MEPQPTPDSPDSPQVSQPPRKWTPPTSGGRIERIMVRSDAHWPWRWFDTPIVVTPQHHTIAKALLVRQMEAAAAQHGLANCKRIALRVEEGDSLDPASIDWELVLAVRNAAEGSVQP